eukprot:jgi/Psemu1/40449/gm1.40449_g
MLQMLLGRNESSSGTISSLTTTRSRRSCPATAIPLHNHEAYEADEEEGADEADVDATSTMMLSHNVTQDGGDSDEEGSLAAAFDVQIQGCNNGKDEDAAVIDKNNNNNNNKNDELHVGMQDGYYYKDGTQVEEATTYPKPPQDYSPSDNNKIKLGKPSWHDVDNPSTWNRFCYQSKEYKGWVFHYKNWVPEEDTPTFSHRYTPNRDLFPQERKGKLDMDKLRKHGLQLGRVLNSDALFFYQLLLPFHTDEDNEKQANKTRQNPFCSHVLKWSNNYANQANTGKGHYVRRIKLSELVHFDGIVYLHGALEGKNGSIISRWTKTDALYSPKIAMKMCWYRWRIKSNLKLNCSHEAKYDMNKFNYAYNKKACSDLCMNESSWAYYGFGGLIVEYLKGKMLSRGGQTVILSDDIFTKYVILEIGKLWSSPPHLTADNFFNGDLILGWMEGLGFGMIGTYFHKEYVSSASGKRCLGVARLCNPVTMVKEVPARAEAGRFTKGKSLGGGKGNGGIEMNNLLELYLQTYRKLDQIDSVILRSNIACKSWKYYHAPINHAKAWAVLTAFDMYQELTDSTHGPAWLLPKRQQLDFMQFKQKLAEQMLAYNPSDKAYPVDTLLREVTTEWYVLFGV